MILGRLVAIGFGPVGEGFVKRAAGAAIAADHRRVARTRVGPRQQAAIGPDEEAERRDRHGLERDRALAIAHLARVVGPPGDLGPTQHGVARRLQQALPKHHPASFVAVAVGEGRHVRRGGGGGRLLDLQEQGIDVAIAHQQNEVDAQADAADADDLMGHIVDVVTPQHILPLGREGGEVGAQAGDHLIPLLAADRGDPGRGRNNPPAAVRVLRRQLHHRRVIVRRLGGLDGSFQGLGRSGVEMLALFAEASGQGVLAPHIDDRHVAQPLQTPTIALHAGHDRLAPRLAAKTVGAAGDIDAGGQTFEVPFPRANCHLVKIIEVDHHTALRRAKQAEIVDVRVAGDHHIHAARGSVRQVPVHNGGRPA